MLLLRAALGGWFVVVSGTYLAHGGQGGWRRLAIGVLAGASGASLVIGFLTPLGVLGGVLTIVLAGWLPPLGPPIFLNEMHAALSAIIAAVAVFLLGPGAFSLDARLFGRREISIPPTRTANPPKAAR